MCIRLDTIPQRDRQTDRQIGRQTDRQTDRQTEGIPMLHRAHTL